MAELPSHPELLCFSEYIEDFLDKNFQVDEFIGKCRRKVSVECLRQDLDSYYRTLKSSMVELINKDYADFVSLSSNLVGMDKSIDDLTTPLGQLQEEIRNVQVSVEATIKATDEKLAERQQIRRDKETLQRLLCILECMEKLERLLQIKRSSQEQQVDQRISEVERLTSKPEFVPMVMERVASEFNKLQYNVKLTDHPVVEASTPRIHVITSTLQSKLEESFRQGLEERDRDVLTQCLQLYASIDRCQAAEGLFQTLVVHPYMDKVISAKALLSHTDGLSGLYQEVLHFIPESCSLLLDITRPLPSADDAEHTGTVRGFDFLVNCVWPEVVSLLEKKASVIFAPGNPDTFHKNYTSSMEFVSLFEEQCRTCSSVKALRNHPSYNTFMSKWSLPVYFQIRFQDIAGTLESGLALPLLPSAQPSSPTPYQLELFSVLEQCIIKCWTDGIFIPALVHRFWKLTLQLLVRVAVWLEEVAALPTQTQQQAEKKEPSKESVPLSTYFKIIHDIELMHTKVRTLFESHISGKLPHLKEGGQLQESLYEASGRLQQLIPKFSALIVTGLAQLCTQSLESANTLPRLYRRTNKEIPSRPSSYVASTLKPLQQRVGDFPQQYRSDWIGGVIAALANRYYEIGSELLTSVQRTEESLLKLKSYRKSLTPSNTGAGGGMTDDNKIRLQLALDIEQFTLQVLAVHPSAMSITAFKQLVEMGQMAKTAAQAAPTT